MRALILLAVLLLPGNVAAMHPCDERNKMVKTLEKSYAEVPQHGGLASNGFMLEVTVAPSGSWTVILTRPNGWTCLMAAGNSWENVPPPKLKHEESL